MIEGEQSLPFGEPVPVEPDVPFTRDDRGYVYVDIGLVAAAARNVFPELSPGEGLRADTQGIVLDGDPTLAQDWRAGIEQSRSLHGRGTPHEIRARRPLRPEQ